MKPSKKKRSRKAAIIAEKEQMTLERLSYVFGSVTISEPASSLTEPNSDPKMAVEILADQSTTCSISSLTASKVHPTSRLKSKKGHVSGGSVSNFLGKDYVSSIPKKVSSEFGFNEDEGQCGYNIDMARGVLPEMSASSREQASGYSESDSRGDEHLLESNSNLEGADEKKTSLEIFIARNKNIENVMTFDLRGQYVEDAIKYLKSRLRFGAIGRSVKTFKFKTGRTSLKTSVMKFLHEEGINWSEENRGTMLVIRLEGETNFSFLNSDSDDDLICRF